MSNNNEAATVKISRETAEAIMTLLGDMPYKRVAHVIQMFAGDLADKQINEPTARERLNAGE